MDSNVSKNTFSHNFFKAQFTQEQTGISIKNLLAKKLRQALNLYQQKLHLQFDPQLFSTIINDKIIFSSPDWQTSASKNQGNQILSQLRSTPIIYTSPIALASAKYLLVSPAIIAENLVQLLTLNQEALTTELDLQFRINVVSPGWLNFYLDSVAIANWLNQARWCLETQPTVTESTTRKNIGNLMPLKYAHARCCSLLRLGVEAQLITLKDDGFNHLAWQLDNPKSIAWLDEQHNLWLTKASEFYLLQQLLRVTDAFAVKTDNWFKLGFDLSIASEIFQAECRFLGEVMQQTPQMAIARLGLIAFVQYWLQRILVEKLQQTAPSSL